MRALSRFVGHLLFHGLPKPKFAWARTREADRCSECHSVLEADADGDLHCPNKCFTLKTQVADAQAKRAAIADISTQVIADHTPRFEEGPTATQGKDYRLPLVTWDDVPDVVRSGSLTNDSWLNSALPAEQKPVVEELSSEQTAEHPTPGTHYLKYERYKFRRLYGRKPS